MVNGSQTVSSVSGASLFVRASSAADVLSTSTIGTAGAAADLPADQVVTETLAAFRYNSIEFSYRQDFGKIVLLRQKPDTGEVIQQFPSEYYLRKYADSERVARSAEGARAAKVAQASAAVVTADIDVPSTPPVAVSTATPAPTPTVAPAPVAPSAPALPSGGVGAASAAGAARVNLTI
jgi:hypothetical protein